MNYAFIWHQINVQQHCHVHLGQTDGGLSRYAGALRMARLVPGGIIVDCDAGRCLWAEKPGVLRAGQKGDTLFSLYLSHLWNSVAHESQTFFFFFF